MPTNPSPPPPIWVLNHLDVQFRTTQLEVQAHIVQFRVSGRFWVSGLSVLILFLKEKESDLASKPDLGTGLRLEPDLDLTLILFSTGSGSFF